MLKEEEERKEKLLNQDLQPLEKILKSRYSR